jgi:DNA-binding XRE family transcriptional regulator
MRMSRTKPRTTTASDFRIDFTPLRRRRRQCEMTQEQLAEAVGVHRGTIWRVETNRTDLTLHAMVAISRKLGMPMHVLFSVVEEPPDER